MTRGLKIILSVVEDLASLDRAEAWIDDPQNAVPAGMKTAARTEIDAERARVRSAARAGLLKVQTP